VAARIELAGDQLVVHIEGSDKLWALKSRLEVPLAHVSSAELAGAEAHERWHGVRIAGSNIPGVLAAGRFYRDGSWVFWDVHDADKAIAIGLHDDHYSRLIVEVADPEGEIARIRTAIGVR
jgi:hypothetical protein